MILLLLALAVAHAPARAGETVVMTLDECLQLAMERNHSRPVSRYAVLAAEAQHRQALAGYWPHITLRGAYELMDEAPTYIFPSSTFAIPSFNIPVPGQTFHLPAGTAMIEVPAQLFNPMAPPGATVQVPVNTPAQSFSVPGQTISLPGAALTIPEQKVELQDRESWYASLGAQWLLWDGGMRKGLRQQARAGVEAAREELRRTDLEVADSVTRLYYGAVLAAQVRQVGEDTLARMEATLNLTETMYQEGSGTVKKTDYLDNKVMVETLRAAVALLEQNETMAQAALAYTIGLGWQDSVRPADTEIPYAPIEANLDDWVGDAYAFSPDWRRLEAGLRAAEGALREARSGHYPNVALTGNLHKWWNDSDQGMATPENKEGWVVGIGAELPLFQGFLTRQKVREARARLAGMEEQRILLREGLGLQVRDVVLQLATAEKRFQATLDAMTAATENRDLNTRAYQNDLVETGDVIRAQLMEAFMSVQHYKMRFDHTELRSRLNRIVGTEVLKALE